MKAIVQHRYGSPADVLKLEDIDKPVVGDNECWYESTRLPSIQISGTP